MKNFLAVLAVTILISACAAPQKETAEPYNRTGSRQEQESVFRNKVFAAYSGEGQFYANYALAELVTQTSDKEGKFTVRFTAGPRKGAAHKTRDIIFKTAPADLENVRKGKVVIRDFWSPANSADSKYDRWNKAVIQDVSKIAEGKIVVEFPRDTNDFIATKETIYTRNVRVVTDPELKDPRTFIP